MELTINELMQGKGTMIKGKEYLSTEAYVTPFLERMSKFTDNFKIQAKLPDQISITKKEDLNLEDTVFNRVWVQAILPTELNFPNHQESISLLYALDTRKPIVKIFKSGLNMACLNMCVFSPSFIEIQELQPEMPINFKCVIPLMEQTSDISEKLLSMANTEVLYDTHVIDKNLGMWMHNSLTQCYDNGFGKVKIAASDVLDAFKMVYMDKESTYYVKPGESTSLFNIYNAFTDIFSHPKRDIVNPIDKIYLLTKILEISDI